VAADGTGRTAHQTIIELRHGVYEISSSIRLARLASVTIRPYHQEAVVLAGSRTIAAWTPLQDPDALKLIAPALRDSIVEIDLEANGVTDAGDILPRGGPGLQLFAGSELMRLSRYPKQGWMLIADVPQTGDSLINKGLEREKRFKDVPAGRHYGKFTYAGDRPSTWSPVNELLLHGYFTFDWYDTYQKVKRISPADRTIEVQPPHHHYGYTTNQRYCALNALEELSSPGEYCINRTKGRLYCYPPALAAPQTTVNGRHPKEKPVPPFRVSMLDAPLLVLDSCRDVLIEGMTLRESRGEGIVIRGGTNVRVDRCTFTHLGRTAVTFSGGTHNGIAGCDLFDLAMGGILLGGGDRATLTPAGNFAENNHIHHFSQWLRTSQYAVHIAGVGNRLAHNLMHDAPHQAVYLSGNDHLVEYNEIHHVTQETGDAGALYSGRDWTWRGTVIRYNYFHHLEGPGLHGVMGVYIDDFASGFTIFGNVFYKAGRGTLIGGGRDNHVENNIYVDCHPSVHIDARGLGWAADYFDSRNPDLFEKMAAVHASEPPYSVRYPELVRLPKDEPAVPKYNTFSHNISYGGRWMDVYDYNAFDFSIVTVKNNIIADTAVMRRRLPGMPGLDPYYLNIDTKEGYITLTSNDSTIRRELRDNVFVKGDPGFVDVEHQDFRLKRSSPAFRAGFKEIPFRSIGLERKE
jgi:hypothetical protein